MIKWILHSFLRTFEKRYNYDAKYMHHITDISTSATFRYMGLTSFSQMRGPVPEVWAGAALASTIDGDCGPCSQLIVDQAIEAGVSAEHLRTCLMGDYITSEAVGLGYRFAEATIHDNGDIEQLRTEIIKLYGEVALIAAAYAGASCRVYPVLKRALGHGLSCQQLRVGDETVSVRK